MSFPLTDEQRDLAAQWVPLACKLAWRKYRQLHGVIEREELESTAQLALCYAAADYDATRGMTFGSWAYGVISQKLTNRVRDYFCRRHLPPTPFSDIFVHERHLPLYDKAVPVETQAEAAEIIAAAQKLPGRQGRVLLKRILHGMTYEEISKEESLQEPAQGHRTCNSKQAVYQNVARAIATLRAQLGVDEAA